MTKDEALAEAGNVKKRAVHDIKKLSRTFLGLLLIADDLDQIGDIEEAAAAAEARLALETKELADHVAQAEALKAKLADEGRFLREAVLVQQYQLREAETAVEAAQISAQRLVASARAEASERIEAAETQALEILNNARDAAAEVKRAADANATAREDQASRVVAERRATVSELNEQIEVAREKLANIRTAIAEIAAR